MYKALSIKVKNGKPTYKSIRRGNSLVLQWLGLGVFTAGGPGSVPDRETKIPQAVWHGPPPPQKKRKRVTYIIM